MMILAMRCWEWRSTRTAVCLNRQCNVVEGIFPDDADGELGESALLFTLRVTNAGKTWVSRLFSVETDASRYTHCHDHSLHRSHTVMGTGFEKKKKSTDNVDYTTPHKEWGIIPRSLHHILSRVKNLNDTTPSSSGGPTLQLFMSSSRFTTRQSTISNRSRRSNQDRKDSSTDHQR